MPWMRVVKKDSTFRKVMETQKDLKDTEGFDWLVLHSPYLYRNAKALAIPPEMRSVTIQAVYYTVSVLSDLLLSILYFFVSVFDILLKIHETEDWPFALETSIPSRKGLVVKQP